MTIRSRGAWAALLAAGILCLASRGAGRLDAPSGPTPRARSAVEGPEATAAFARAAGAVVARRRGVESESGPYAVALDAIELSEHERRLVNAFGRDPAGTRLRRMILLARHSASMPDGVTLHNEYFNKLLRDPAASAHAIRAALEKLPSDAFSAERVALLQWLAELPGSEEEAAALALREAGEDAGAIGGEDRAALAHSLYLRFTEGRRAIAPTADLVLAHDDPFLARTLVAQFASSYPEHEAELREELRRRRPAARR